MSDLVGKTIGKYRIVARLGRGGMAEVFKAYQPGLDRYVAVKVMHSHLSDDSDFIGRFKREATAVANLRHPDIVQAYDFDVQDDLYYMVMEFIEGPTLKAELKEREARGQHFSLKEVSRIFGALASAIDYAHSRGMVHRDLKPANIMFTKEGQVVLTDFGIARIVGATRYTMTGAISGTPAYMSPEQGQGERGDERSDIYSLGVILYEMVVGRVPFDADTPFAIILKHINEPLPLPRAVRPDLPEAVERVILKALSKDPNDRYGTAGEMAQALRDAVGVTPTETLAALPIVTLATAPQVQEIPITPDMAVGPSRTYTGSAGTQQAAGATAMDAGATAAVAAGTAAAQAKSGGFPVVPVVIAGAIVAVLCLAGVILYSTGVLGGGANARAQQATQTAAAVEVAVVDNTEAATPVPAATYTPQPTYTPFPTYTSPPQPTATERVVVVTATDLPSTDTPTPEPATETPTPEPATDTPQSTDTPLPATKAPTAESTSTGDGEETEGNTEEGGNTGGTGSIQGLSGNLAVPVDDNMGHYDVIIYSLPDGKQIGKITKARQPNFRADGLLAVNGEGGANENVWRYDANGGGGVAVSASPGDNHPFWKFDGSGLVYDNPEMVCAKIDCPEWHVFVQQGEGVPETRDVADKLMIDGDIFRDQPMFPVWAADDTIIFRACDIWPGGGGGTCGMWKTPSWQTRGAMGFSVPVRLSSQDEIPTDTKGDKLVYMSAKEGNWDVYVTGINGGPGTNLSNSPADDGLGTISPDGKWVAFVSSRDGSWGVWVVPISGGTPQRLPIDIPGWGTGLRDWTTERMSWGPK